MYSEIIVVVDAAVSNVCLSILCLLCLHHTLTCCVNVKVGGFVCHVACALQSWSSSVDFAGVTHCLCHIYCVGTLVYVLTCKQHFHLQRHNQ